MLRIYELKSASSDGAYHYLGRPKGVVWMLTIHPKSETNSIPARVPRQIREEIERDQQ